MFGQVAMRSSRKKGGRRRSIKRSCLVHFPQSDGLWISVYVCICEENRIKKHYIFFPFHRVFAPLVQYISPEIHLSHTSLSEINSCLILSHSFPSSLFPSLSLSPDFQIDFPWIPTPPRINWTAPTAALQHRFFVWQTESPICRGWSEPISSKRKMNR